MTTILAKEVWEKHNMKYSIETLRRNNDKSQKAHSLKLVNNLQGKIIELKVDEPEVCKFFGCGRRLTRREKLFGNRCINHSAL